MIKSAAELDTMRGAGRIVARVLARMAEMAQPGTPLHELDSEAEAIIRDAGAVPLFKGYRGYPNTVCASINEQVVHGIPGARRLAEGDIVSIDVGAGLDGLAGDAARTLAVGRISDEARRLLAVCRAALDKGIEQVVADGRLSAVSRAIQTHAESNGYSVVRTYTGHGIGRSMHEEPQIPNFVSPVYRVHDPVLKAGMTLAIEPMVNIGTHRVKTLKDGWTVVTDDGSLSAHFEDTVAVTEGGPEILTRPDTTEAEQKIHG